MHRKSIFPFIVGFKADQKHTGAKQADDNGDGYHHIEISANDGTDDSQKQECMKRSGFCHDGDLGAALVIHFDVQLLKRLLIAQGFSVTQQTEDHKE